MGKRLYKPIRVLITFLFPYVVFSQPLFHLPYGFQLQVLTWYMLAGSLFIPKPSTARYMSYKM